MADNHSSFADTVSASYTNPPFDPRRYSTNPYYAGLQQGFMVRNGLGGSNGALGKTTTATQTAVAGKGVLDSVKLRFLYNPSDFTVSLTPSDALFPNVNGATGSNANDTASLIGQTTTSASFNLLFDRSYELNAANNSTNTATSAPTGVSVDIVTFKALLGIPLNGVGQALFLPVHMYLGGGQSLDFYGVITTATIVYTHFSVNMVPMRAAITIGMTQWLDDTSGPTAADGQSVGPTPLGPPVNKGSTQKVGTNVYGPPVPRSGTTPPVPKKIGTTSLSPTTPLT